MKNIIALVKNNLRILVIKKPGYTILMVMLPIMVVIGLSKILGGDSSPIKVGILDNSKSFSASKVIESIDSGDLMKCIKYTTKEEIDNSFATSDIDLAIVINNDFEEKLLKGDSSGIVIKGIENENLSKMLSGIVNVEVNNLSNLAKVNNGDYSGYKGSVEKYKSSATTVSKDSLNDLYGDYSKSQTLIGFLIIFAFYRAMSGSGLIGEDKEENIYTRILVTPVKVWQYYVSNIISSILLVIILFSVSIVGIKLVSDVNIGMSYFYLFIILCTVSIVAVSVGCFCSTVTDDRDLSSIISNFILMTFLAIGGCFVPIRYLSPIVNKLSYATPTRWAMEAVTNLQQGEGIRVIAMDLGIVILFGCVFFIASIYCINRRDKIDNLN